MKTFHPPHHDPAARAVTRVSGLCSSASQTGRKRTTPAALLALALALASLAAGQAAVILDENFVIRKDYHNDNGGGSAALSTTEFHNGAQSFYLVATNDPTGNFQNQFPPTLAGTYTELELTANPGAASASARNVDNYADLYVKFWYKVLQTPNNATLLNLQVGLNFVDLDDASFDPKVERIATGWFPVQNYGDGQWRQGQIRLAKVPTASRALLDDGASDDPAVASVLSLFTVDGYPFEIYIDQVEIFDATTLGGGGNALILEDDINITFDGWNFSSPTADTVGPHPDAAHDGATGLRFLYPGRPWGGGPLVTEENLEGVNDAPSASRDLRNYCNLALRLWYKVARTSGPWETKDVTLQLKYFDQDNADDPATAEVEGPQNETVANGTLTMMNDGQWHQANIPMNLVPASERAAMDQNGNSQPDVPTVLGFFADASIHEGANPDNPLDFYIDHVEMVGAPYALILEDDINITFDGWNFSSPTADTVGPHPDATHDGGTGLRFLYPGRPWGGGPLVTEENLEGVNDAVSTARNLTNYCNLKVRLWYKVARTPSPWETKDVNLQLKYFDQDNADDPMTAEVEGPQNETVASGTLTLANDGQWHQAVVPMEVVGAAQRAAMDQNGNSQPDIPTVLGFFADASIHEGANPDNPLDLYIDHVEMIGGGEEPGVTISISLNEQGFPVVTWTGAGVLERSTDLSDPNSWTAVENATSPYLDAAAVFETGVFYRLRLP
jgi:hypothetical protein